MYSVEGVPPAAPPAAGGAAGGAALAASSTRAVPSAYSGIAGVPLEVNAAPPAAPPAAFIKANKNFYNSLSEEGKKMCWAAILRTVWLRPVFGALVAERAAEGFVDFDGLVGDEGAEGERLAVATGGADGAAEGGEVGEVDEVVVHADELDVFGALVAELAADGFGEGAESFAADYGLDGLDALGEVGGLGYKGAAAEGGAEGGAEGVEVVELAAEGEAARPNRPLGRPPQGCPWEQHDGKWCYWDPKANGGEGGVYVKRRPTQGAVHRPMGANPDGKVWCYKRNAFFAPGS